MDPILPLLRDTDQTRWSDIQRGTRRPAARCRHRHRRSVTSRVLPEIDGWWGVGGLGWTGADCFSQEADVAPPHTEPWFLPPVSVTGESGGRAGGWGRGTKGPALGTALISTAAPAASQPHLSSHPLSLSRLFPLWSIFIRARLHRAHICFHLMKVASVRLLLRRSHRLSPSTPIPQLPQDDFASNN